MTIKFANKTSYNGEEQFNFRVKSDNSFGSKSVLHRLSRTEGQELNNKLTAALSVPKLKKHGLYGRCIIERTDVDLGDPIYPLMEFVREVAAGPYPDSDPASLLETLQKRAAALERLL